MLMDLAAMDAALALGPVQIECNVCGRHHSVVAVDAAVPEWEEHLWLQCLAYRCAEGLHWSQKNTSAAELKRWAQQLRSLYGAEEGRRGPVRFVYKACPEAFAGFDFGQVQTALRDIYGVGPYEYMFATANSNDIDYIKGYVYQDISRREFPVRSPWMLAVDSRIANRRMAKHRVKTLLAVKHWPAILAGARGFVEALPRACLVSSEYDYPAAFFSAMWDTFAASSAITALYARLVAELENLESTGGIC